MYVHVIIIVECLHMHSIIIIIFNTLIIVVHLHVALWTPQDQETLLALRSTHSD